MGRRGCRECHSVGCPHPPPARDPHSPPLSCGAVGAGIARGSRAGGGPEGGRRCLSWSWHRPGSSMAPGHVLGRTQPWLRGCSRCPAGPPYGARRGARSPLLLPVAISMLVPRRPAQGSDLPPPPPPPLESYAAYWDYHDVMDEAEGIIRAAAKVVSPDGKITYQGTNIFTKNMYI